MTSVPHSGAKSVTPGGSVVGGHTKGPWSALGDRVVSEATWDTVAATGYVTNGARTLAVGAVETTAEERANARLIAASPAMYDYVASKADAGDEEALKIVEVIHASR